uniref:Putative salivary kunitz domain protein n=1 Tax=Ixodes ricinus TaxID=34613 RepID=A0A6B0U6S8_IXORI
MRFSCILGVLAMCLIAAKNQDIPASYVSCQDTLPRFMRSIDVQLRQLDRIAQGHGQYFGHLAFLFANMEVGGTVLGRHIPLSIRRTERLAGDIWACVLEYA